MIRRLLQGIWLRTQKEDGVNSSRLRLPQRNHDLPKETVAAIIMLYKNKEVKVRSPDRDTDYSDIVSGVLQGDTLAPYMFIICLHYVIRTSIDLIKENGFKLAKEKKQKIPRLKQLRTRITPMI